GSSTSSTGSPRSHGPGAAAASRSSSTTARSRSPTSRSADPPRLAALGVADLARDGLEELPRDVGVVLDERAEIPRRHAVAAKLALGPDRGRALAVGDQCDLAEVVAGAEAPDRLPTDEHSRVAGLDDEE